MFRLAKGARRALGESATRRIVRSPIGLPLRRALAADAPDGPDAVEVLGGALRGARLYVDMATEKHYWLGTHEPLVQAVLQRQVRAGDVVWDIGAHVGFFTVLMARQAGSEGRVYAFEPVDRNAVRLEENIDANGLHNVVICPAAVGDVSGFVAFADGATSLEGRIDQAGTMRVECVTVDSAIAAGCMPPTLMKVDVEGAEAAVIRGAAATITKFRPRILIEIHSIDAGAEVARAMPVAYVFADVGTRCVVDAPFPAGHYFAVPAEGVA